MMNQLGANIPYPYHELPLITSEDRLGFWALQGITESIIDDMDGTDESKTKNKKIISCGDRREDEK